MPTPKERWSTLTLVNTGLVCTVLGLLIGRSVFRAPPASASSVGPNASASRALESRPEGANIHAVSDAPLRSTERAPAGGADWDRRWSELTREASSPGREREMSLRLKELARADPKRAVALAMAEQNLRFRESLLNAALEGWASKNPDEAVAWATTLAEDRRRQAIDAVLLGAAGADPEATIRIGSRLCAQEPALVAEYSHAVVNALGQAGAFEAAVRFAASGSVEQRAQLLSSAFHQWAQHRPEQAREALSAFQDPGVRSEALQGLISGWAYTQPAALADYAMQLPAGEERARVLREALPQWVARDPVATLQWLDKFDPGPDFDAGVAAVANLGTLIAKNPQVAASWAESIFDPSLRKETLRSIVEQWARHDANAARRYVEALKELSADERAQMIDAASISRR